MGFNSPPSDLADVNKLMHQKIMCERYYCRKSIYFLKTLDKRLEKLDLCSIIMAHKSMKDT